MGIQGEAILALLEEHIAEMYATSPPENVHTLDISELRKPDITFWSIWRDDVTDHGDSQSTLAGCVALKAHDPQLCEIKSMRTAKGWHRKGVASALLQHIIAYAKQQGYQRISLETGIEEHFIAARQLYAKFGFVECDPFAQYVYEPTSVYMTLALRASQSS